MLSLNKSFLIVALWLCVFGIFPSSAKDYVVGVEDVSYYPLFDFGQGRESYAKELIDEFGRQYGHTFTYLPLPIKRFSKWLIEEQIDFKYPDNVRWNASQTAHETFIFSDSTIRLVAGTITVADKPMPKDRLKVLGTLLGFYPTLWINEIKRKEVTLYESSATLVLLQNVLRGQVDAIDIEPSVVMHHLKRLGRPNALALNTNYKFEVYDYYLSTIRHGDVIAEFNQFLKDNQAYLIKLRKKYEIFDHRPYEVMQKTVRLRATQ